MSVKNSLRLCPSFSYGITLINKKEKSMVQNKENLKAGRTFSCYKLYSRASCYLIQNEQILKHKYIQMLMLKSQLVPIFYLAFSLSFKHCFKFVLVQQFNFYPFFFLFYCYRTSALLGRGSSLFFVFSSLQMTIPPQQKCW